MSIFIKFNDGRYSQFDECDSIEFTYGRLIIFEDNVPFVYGEDEIKEMIFVIEYTLPYAIFQGYEL
jgi:hypothetical protein